LVEPGRLRLEATRYSALETLVTLVLCKTSASWLVWSPIGYACFGMNKTRKSQTERVDRSVKQGPYSSFVSHHMRRGDECCFKQHCGCEFEQQHMEYVQQME